MTLLVAATPVDGVDLPPVVRYRWAGYAGERNVREAHLDWCIRRGLRPNTIAAKRSALSRFARAVAPATPENATLEDVTRWYETVGGLAQHRHCELSHVRQFYAYLIREGHRLDDPTRRLMAPKIRRRLPRPIGDADLRKAVEQAPEPVRSWLLFGALAGLRSCEIAGLHRNDLLLDLEGPMLYVANGKGGRDRTIPLHPTLAALEHPERGYLWPEGGSHVPARKLMRLINAYLASVGVHATSHQLRHRFLSKFYEASGCDLRATQEVAGHQSPTHTAIYTVWSQTKAGLAVADIEI